MKARYSEVTSIFIRQKLKSTSWKDRSYIDNLISLHHYIAHPPRTFFGNLHFFNLKHTLQNDFLTLIKETAPERFEEEKSKLQKHKVVISSDEKGLKDDWLKAGGKE